MVPHLWEGNFILHVKRDTTLEGVALYQLLVAEMRTYGTR